MRIVALFFTLIVAGISSAADFQIYIPKTKVAQTIQVVVQHATTYNNKEVKDLDLLIIGNIFTPLGITPACSSEGPGESGHQPKRICAAKTKGGAYVKVSDRLRTYDGDSTLVWVEHPLVSYCCSDISWTDRTCAPLN